MTLLEWALSVLVALMILIPCLAYGIREIRDYDNIVAGVISIVVGTVVAVGIIVGLWFYFHRDDDTEKSVRVYDENGQMIEQYEGKLDISYDTNRIILDDENGKRYIIYQKTGIVIIE